MDVSAPTVSASGQHMVAHMRMRKVDPNTLTSDLRAVRRLAAFLMAAPNPSLA